VLSVSLALSLAVMTPTDSVRRVVDTLYIEPLGVRATVPALWMGRIPAGATMVSPGKGRFGCQLNVGKPVNERVVTDRLTFPAIFQGIYGPLQSAQEALDSILPRSGMVASVGGDQFNGHCVAPHIHLYVTDTAAIAAVPVAAIAQRVVEKVFSRVKRIESDSASWHVIHLSWDDRQTDFLKPGTLDIMTRRFRDRVLIVAVMDGWSDRIDANEFLASIR
jgi:hypothetical protein